MAKKKKKRRKNPSHSARFGRNKHHILWMRREWCKGIWSNKLRNHPAMIIEVNADGHRRIHELVRRIPVPSESVCKATYEQLTHLYEYGALNDKTSLKIRIEVLVCCLAYVADDTVDALKEQLEVASNLGL